MGEKGALPCFGAKVMLEAPQEGDVDDPAPPV